MRADNLRSNTALYARPRSPAELDAWLGQVVQSPVCDAELPIIDTHHHFFDRSRGPTAREKAGVSKSWPNYMLPDLFDDLGSGHNVVGTVFVACEEMYRADGPEHLKPVGETEFVRGLAAMASSGYYGSPAHHVAAGIVGFADLTQGDRVEEVLAAHVEAGGGRFRGVRMMHTREIDLGTWGVAPKAGGLMEQAEFRAGLKRLVKHNLSYDALVWFMQLPQLSELASALPDVRIIANHCGGIVGTQAHESRHADYFETWKKSVVELARRPNVFMKLGGIAKPGTGFPYLLADVPPTVDELAAAWRPYIETCIEVFGASRCMFESNFPVDHQSCSYRDLWNTFKTLTRSCSRSEREALFANTAQTAYRLAV